MSGNISFLKDVELGLSNKPKFISSHYFYDKAGDVLFQQIMEMPEYYLTNSEMEIFREQSETIIEAFSMVPTEEFELIELGAGDGKKTQHLLQALLQKEYNFKYIPVDISANSLQVISGRLRNLFPGLNIETRQGEYFQVLDALFRSPNPKVIMFIGSNLGNMVDEVAVQFLAKISRHLKSGEKLLLGLDLMKSAEIILPAYNDAAGITRDFNLNLLKRINREFGADFNIAEFEHVPEYDESEGIAKSYLKSTKAQKVFIRDLGRSFDFDEGEKIHTEISRKYNDMILNDLMKGTSLEIEQKFLDSRKYFADYIINKQ
ncbi:L-histidine N(alpha)-methyltransferase [Kaistella palustris]|uniref:L-histidine N(alpha)-methyltransferase n=1 Tax=Kaistella palustris TaxID=493376 RepID=UPI0003F57407|nr:L-histidine N(alpha)-methyltransferase [Kaistella palustris]